MLKQKAVRPWEFLLQPCKTTMMGGAGFQGILWHCSSRDTEECKLHSAEMPSCLVYLLFPVVKWGPTWCREYSQKVQSLFLTSAETWLSETLSFVSLSPHPLLPGVHLAMLQVVSCLRNPWGGSKQMINQNDGLKFCLCLHQCMLSTTPLKLVVERLFLHLNKSIPSSKNKWIRKEVKLPFIK